MLPGNLHGPDDGVARARHDDAQRLDLIDAGVGRVQRARDAIEADFTSRAPERVFEVRLEGRGRQGALRYQPMRQACMLAAVCLIGVRAAAAQSTESPAAYRDAVR